MPRSRDEFGRVNLSDRPTVTDLSLIEPNGLCSTQGHVLSDDPLPYIDGVLAARCHRCGERVVIEWVEGGMASMRLKFLASLLLSEKAENLTNWPKVMEDFLRQLERAEADRLKLDEAVALAELAKARIAQDLQS